MGKACEKKKKKNKTQREKIRKRKPQNAERRSPRENSASCGQEQHFEGKKTHVRTSKAAGRNISRRTSTAKLAMINKPMSVPHLPWYPPKYSDLDFSQNDFSTRRLRALQATPSVEYPLFVLLPSTMTQTLAHGYARPRSQTNHRWQPQCCPAEEQKLLSSQDES